MPVVMCSPARVDAAQEFNRRSTALGLCGPSGLSMGLSLVAESALREHLSDTEGRPLVANLG
jgi:hypothetical protein